MRSASSAQTTAKKSRVEVRTLWPTVSLILRYAALSVWAFVCLFPMYWAAISSIKAPTEFVSPPHYVPWIDFTPSLHAWRQLTVDPTDNTLLRFWNSVVVAVGATALTPLTGAMAASGFRAVGTGRRFLLPTILATRLLPPVVIVLPLYYAVQGLGIFDTRSGLILVYTAANLPIAVWLLWGYVRDVSRDLEDAAQLDGASRFRVFFTITVPVMWRGMAATAVLVFLLCWNEYLLSVYLTAEHSMTMPPFLASQMTSREQMAAAEPDDYARLAVVLVLLVGPLFIFAGLFRRIVTRIGRGA
jgi:multiple sugar transport system permease protein